MSNNLGALPRLNNRITNNNMNKGRAGYAQGVSSGCRIYEVSPCFGLFSTYFHLLEAKVVLGVHF